MTIKEKIEKEFNEKFTYYDNVDFIHKKKKRFLNTDKISDIQIKSFILTYAIPMVLEAIRKEVLAMKRYFPEQESEEYDLGNQNAIATAITILEQVKEELK